MTIERLQPMHERDVVALLDDLRVSLFGVSSHRLHKVLAHDAAAEVIDGRVAVDGGRLRGLVLAAPASYWRVAMLAHWVLAMECAAARITLAVRRSPMARLTDRHRGERATSHNGAPARTWADPGDAWRIIIVGTAEDARGRGIGAELYRHVMAERPLVARIAADNAASIRLHQSLGWRIYPDGPVLLAVHHSAGAAAG